MSAVQCGGAERFGVERDARRIIQLFRFLVAANYYMCHGFRGSSNQNVQMSCEYFTCELHALLYGS
jgi:hypothetical protein